MPEIDTKDYSQPGFIEVREVEDESGAFPELRLARKIGNLMEKAPPEMQCFILGWLDARYGHGSWEAIRRD